ncbi:MAG: T9SS type A sorting domain-containing protein [Putridiphycobacter sp.]|nr:T9SS type A sorting domain-containing protein [Putridiphycobacter sp.]
MKKALLIISILTTGFGYSQKLLNATVEKYYDQFGSLDYGDSTAHNYNSWLGYLDDLKPKFGYDGDIMYFFMEDQIIHCNSEDEYYYQGTLPFSFDGTTNNTLTNGLVTQSDNSSGFFRSLYTYDAQGNMLTEVNQYDNGGVWETADSTSFTYDALGNKTVEVGYYNGQLEFLDSLFYQAGTSNLIEASDYYFDGTNFVIDYRTTVSWAGNNVNQVNLYEGDGSGGLNWTFTLNYNYNGNLVSGFDAYEVANNVPNSFTFATGHFTHTVQNDPESYFLIIDGDTLGRTVFHYDSEGFVNRVENYEMGDNGMYLGWVTDYYYTNLASVNEIEQVEVTVYPNPATDFLSISSDEKIEQIKIVDMNGQVVLTQNSSTAIEVSQLSKGTYLIIGSTNGQVFKQTFIKQ